MLDKDLAELYDVTTGNLNKAVKRNIARFLDDFMFQLTEKEYEVLRFQIGILKQRQHAKYLPYVYTEQGVAMLSVAITSDRAVAVNIQIMRIFTRIRQMLMDNTELRLEIEKIKKKEKPQPTKKIGFKIKGS